MADLSATRPESPDFEILVTVLDGDTYTIKVNHTTTVVELKQKMLEQSGILLDSMRLMYEAKELGDYIGNTRNPTPLSAYDIHEGFTIHVVRRAPELPIAPAGPPPLADPEKWNGSVSRSGSTKSTTNWWSSLVKPSAHKSHKVWEEKATKSTTNWLSPLPEPSSKKSHKVWEERATDYDFDEDLYIVNPQAHFELLKNLELDIFERSEYCAANQAYDVADSIDITIADEAVLRRAGLSDPLRTAILEALPKGQGILGVFFPAIVDIGHLIKSYSIVSKATQSLAQMSRLQFCTGSISILINHVGTNIVEIKPIPTQMIERIETGLERAIKRLTLEIVAPSVVRPPDVLAAWDSCLALLCHLGLEDYNRSSFPRGSSKVILTAIRTTVLLIDNAVVSYVRSHGSGLDSDYFGREITDMSVGHGNESFAFKGYWAKLACLDAFLGKRKVWVLCLFDKKLPQVKRPSSERMSVLTRMKDFADIWGPVYTVPSKSGLIKNYGVSNGVICRVAQNKQSAALHATRCHYISRLEFTRRRASRLLFGDSNEELCTSNDDLLLIGAELRENRRCQYGLSDLTYETQSEVRFLGTRESVWRTDTRSIAVGLSKYLAVTVSGTQKFIPQTTLKQHILDKWTTNPSRANPGILDQLLGVEISHCTGNARRISLRELLITKPILSILERQSPDWTEKQWGSDFAAALSSDNGEDIFRVWKDHTAHRAEISDLVCCVLELLDSTGLDESGQFHSALFNDNKDLAIRVPTKLNDWSIALKDTHLTGAYVITNEICLECEVPDHSTSTCESNQSYTVLQTQLATARLETPIEGGSHLRPYGMRLVQIDCGSADIVVLRPTGHSGLLSRTSMRNRYGKFLDRTACSYIELPNRTPFGSTRNTVFLAASKLSSHGRREVKNPSQRPVLPWQRRNTTAIAERKLHQASMMSAPLASDNHPILNQSDASENHNNSCDSDIGSEIRLEYPLSTSMGLPLWQLNPIAGAETEIGDLERSDINGQDIYDFSPSWRGIQGPLARQKYQKTESETLGSGVMNLGPSGSHLRLSHCHHH
ncbi:MAG: hypothetical protein Q9178_004720 [Gyalolechia marmorata]